MPIKSATFVSWWLVLLISLAGPPGHSSHAQPQPKVVSVSNSYRIVLLYSYGDGIPAYQQVTRGFLSVMKEARVSVNDLFFEYLDLERSKFPRSRAPGKFT